MSQTARGVISRSKAQPVEVVVDTDNRKRYPLDEIVSERIAPVVL